MSKPKEKTGKAAEPTAPSSQAIPDTGTATDPASGGASSETASELEPQGQPVPTIAGDATEDGTLKTDASANPPVVETEVTEEAITIALTLPLPPNIPADVLESARIVVKAKPLRGRRRAGFGFTRDETLIPLVSLDEAQLQALVDDPELVTALRLPRPR